MPFAKCKVYSDGSHYIAIPPKPQKPRPKKGAKVKKEAPDLEELDDDEAEDCPFDKPAQPVQSVQLSLFDGEKNDDKQGESEENGSKNGQMCEENEEQTKDTPSRKDLFDTLYKKYIFEPKAKRRKILCKELRPYCKDDSETELFVELNLRRKQKNLIARRIRMTRKANLQEFNYFVTLTYNNAIHTEDSFRKKLRTTLSHFCDRKGWRYMGVWERSPEKKRLHFHGIFYIPDGTLSGEMEDINSFNFTTRRRQITKQNSFFAKRFGRNDFEKIEDKNRLGDALAYIMKYIEKSGEKIVYSRGLAQFFISDIMEEDIVCPYGMEEQKFLLFDDFVCWDEGEYIDQVSRETIAKMPKAN